MLTSVKSILYATDLSDRCKPAFDFATSLAVKYQATIILLHVTEKIPDYVETRLKGLFGEEEFNNIAKEHEKSIQASLTAKKSSNGLIQAALEQFCASYGIDDKSCGYHSREIVILKGDIADEIINQSKRYQCDIIILGGRKGLLKKTAVSSTIKEVLGRSETPVLIVPPHK